MSLYDLVGEYKRLYDLLVDGEIDDQVFQDNLACISYEERLESHAEWCAKMIANFDGQISAVDAELDRLAKIRMASQKGKQRIKNYLYGAMKGMDCPKIRTSLFNFRIQANPPKIVVDDIDALRNDVSLWKARKWDESELNKDEIKHRLQAGKAVDGVHLEQGESLRIQ